VTPGGPQGLNRYSYVNNNPINNIDPSGHLCIKHGNSPCIKDGDYEKPKPRYPSIRNYPPTRTPTQPFSTPTPTFTASTTSTPTYVPTISPTQTITNTPTSTGTETPANAPTMTNYPTTLEGIQTMEAQNWSRSNEGFKDAGKFVFGGGWPIGLYSAPDDVMKALDLSNGPSGLEAWPGLNGPLEVISGIKNADDKVSIIATIFNFIRDPLEYILTNGNGITPYWQIYK
jgi:hypothetical protein